MSKTERDRRADAHRRKAHPWRAWYKTRLWLARRRAQLTGEPLCRRCAARELVVLATVANHLVPHRGDWNLFATGELESLCKPCHDGLVQAEENRGYVVGCDQAGRPLDPAHPWNVMRS